MSPKKMKMATAATSLLAVAALTVTAGCSSAPPALTTTAAADSASTIVSGAQALADPCALITHIMIQPINPAFADGNRKTDRYSGLEKVSVCSYTESGETLGLTITTPGDNVQVPAEQQPSEKAPEGTQGQAVNGTWWERVEWVKGEYSYVLNLTSPREFNPSHLMDLYDMANKIYRQL